MATGFRGKMDELKTISVEKVQSAKVCVRDGVNNKVAKAQTSMRTSPMKWVGIAAGSGFAIGLAGRIADYRRNKRRMTPDLVIIDATC